MFGSDGVIVNRLRRLRLTVPQALSRALAATVFPPRCCLCGFEGSSLDLDLCHFCFAALPWSEDGNGVAALRFEPPVDDLIRELKYHGVAANARVLGVLLAESVRERRVALPRLLVPVPLHPARLRDRGFNQALAIARYAGRMLGVPFARGAVRRVRDTPSQTELDVYARRRNVSGAFAVAGRRAQARLTAASHVAVVDDVVTTGSTVQELRRVLLSAGVQRVDVWAVASAN